MDLLNLYRQVSGLIDNDTRQNNSVDTNGLLGKIGQIFGQNDADNAPHYDQHYQENYANQGGYEPQQSGGILPASMDPYGDPADAQNAGYQQQGSGNILPASMDPYGDPADAPRR